MTKCAVFLSEFFVMFSFFEHSVSTPPFTLIILSLSRLPIELSGTLLASWLADGIGLQRGVVLGAAAVSLACVPFADGLHCCEAYTQIYI